MLNRNLSLLINKQKKKEKKASTITSNYQLDITFICAFFLFRKFFFFFFAFSSLSKLHRKIFSSSFIGLLLLLVLFVSQKTNTDKTTEILAEIKEKTQKILLCGFSSAPLYSGRQKRKRILHLALLVASIHTDRGDKLKTFLRNLFFFHACGKIQRICLTETVVEQDKDN